MSNKPTENDPPAHAALTGELGPGSAMDSVRSDTVATLKERCAGFGVEPTTADLIDAGLLLLMQQTETALEVALLQSLREDRSFTKRKGRRRAR